MSITFTATRALLEFAKGTHLPRRQVNSGLVVNTNATWDPATQGFILHTPNEGARKNWISQGLVADKTVVVADLRIDGKSYGPHAFLMDLCVNGRVVPGVSHGDMGRKTVGNDLDNAWIAFDGVRLPHGALLNRYADVEDGKYVQKVKGIPVFHMIGQRLFSGTRPAPPRPAPPRPAPPRPAPPRPAPPRPCGDQRMQGPSLCVRGGRGGAGRGWFGARASESRRGAAGRVAVAQAALEFRRGLFEATRAYTDRKRCWGPVEEQVLSGIPQLKALYAEVPHPPRHHLLQPPPSVRPFPLPSPSLPPPTPLCPTHPRHV